MEANLHRMSLMLRKRAARAQIGQPSSIIRCWAANSPA
jgi:hypothetical protein